LTQRVNELQSLIAEARIRLEAESLQQQASVNELEALLQTRTVLELQQGELRLELDVLDKTESEFELVEQRGIAKKAESETIQLRVDEIKRRQSENLEKIAELSTHNDSGPCPLCAAPIVDRAAVIQKYRKDNEAMDSQISELGLRAAEVEHERNQLRKEYAKMKQRLDARKILDTQIGQLNERLLAVERAGENLQRIRAENELLNERLSRQDFAQVERESLVGVKAEIIKLEFDPAQFAAIQAQFRAERYAEIRYQQWQRDLAELKKLTDRTPELQLRYESLKSQLDAESYGTEVRTALHDLQGQIEVLDYDKSVHAELNKRLSELLPRTEEFRDFQRAQSEQPNVLETLQGCRETLNKKIEEETQLLVDLETWKNDLEDAPELGRSLAALSGALNQLKEERERLARAVAVSESELERLRGQLSQLTERRTEFDAIRSEIDDYAFLAEAFGKKGIQAVIIENAIPELEAEANRILSRLTENKMHVALVTQQRTKSGGTLETLEILIGDEIGTRNYELYSGGE
ncbi:MAG TPA: hypothetical protein V6C72_06305, partial [Chroococcales cyanobacterium]